MSNFFLLGWDAKTTSLHYHEIEQQRWTSVANFDAIGKDVLNSPQCCTAETKDSFFIMFQNHGECQVGSQNISHRESYQKKIDNQHFIRTKQLKRIQLNTVGMQDLPKMNSKKYRGNLIYLDGNIYVFDQKSMER